MTLPQADIASAAHALFEAERTRVQIGLLSRQFPLIDMDDSYAIQAEWVRQKIIAGDSIVGWKIGLTSRAMQAALAIETPDSGVLLDSMVFREGATIPRERFIEPRIEAEIAFVLARPLAGEVTPEAVLDATHYVAPVLEILDTRILRKDPDTGCPRNVFDTISDNAANAGLVMGQPVHDFQSMDLRWIGSIVSKNDVVEETGLGAGVLNSPALSVAWLAKRLSRYGNRIEAGQVVLSGSFIRPVEAPPGSVISADFGPFGRVGCHFE